MRDLKDKIPVSRPGERPRYMSTFPRTFSTWGRAGRRPGSFAAGQGKGIRRIGRGLFDYPRVNPRLNIVLSPDPEAVAQAVARKRGGRVQRSGAFAANSLGLSTQVPGKQIYLTDASPGTVELGKQTLTFKQVAPKRAANPDKVTSSVVEALHYIGKDGLTDSVLSRLRATLSEKDKKRLLKESRYAVGWIADAVKKVAAETE